MAVLTYNGNIIGKSSANDGVLTIKRNNVTLDTFSANSASNKTINISVPTKLSDLTDDIVSGNYLKVTNSIGQQVATTESEIPLVLKGNHAKNTWLGFKNSNNTTMGYLGIHEDYGPVYYDTALHGIALKQDVTWKYSFKFLLNSASSDKWYSFYRKGINLTSSCCYLVSIGVDQFAYTGGTTFTFLLASYYQQLYIFPVSTSAQSIAWMPKFRSSSDDTYRYLEFQCITLQSPYNNYFWINIVPLNHAGLEHGDTFFSPTESVATSVQREFTVNDGTFRCASYGEVIRNSNAGTQLLTNTDTGTSVVLALKSSYPNAGANQALIRFYNDTDTLLGYLGVKDYKPYFLSNGGVYSELALKDGVVKLTNADAQTITNTQADSILPLIVQGDSADNCIIQFRGKNGVTFGSIGAKANIPIFRNGSGIVKEIALENDVPTTYRIYGGTTLTVSAKAGDLIAAGRASNNAQFLGIIDWAGSIVAFVNTGAVSCSFANNTLTIRELTTYDCTVTIVHTR